MSGTVLVNFSNFVTFIKYYKRNRELDKILRKTPKEGTKPCVLVRTIDEFVRMINDAHLDCTVLVFLGGPEGSPSVNS